MDEMWDGFAAAVVTLDLPEGRAVLTPRPPGVVGAFPFDTPVHIVTAHNPAGRTTEEVDNAARHLRLGEAVADHETIASVGSAPDGSMAEPGYAVLGLSLDDAVRLGARFGQRAIYRWTADALTIVGVTEAHRRRLGWVLSPVT